MAPPCSSLRQEKCASTRFLSKSKCMQVARARAGPSSQRRDSLRAPPGSSCDESISHRIRCARGGQLRNLISQAYSQLPTTGSAHVRFTDLSGRTPSVNPAIRNLPSRFGICFPHQNLPSRTRHVSPPPCETRDGRGKHHTAMVARRCASSSSPISTLSLIHI